MKALLYSWAGAANSELIFETHFDFPYRKQRIAYVPNAKDSLEVGQKNREITSSIESFCSKVKSVTKFDLYQMQNIWSVEYMVQNFDTIYVGGGMMRPLLKAVKETGFDKLLHELRDNEVKYVGSSAGAMLASHAMSIAGWYPGEEEPEVADKRGLGWIPFELFPHYRSEDHYDAIKMNITSPLIVLPDNSAVGLDGGELRFYNQARMIV